MKRYQILPHIADLRLKIYGCTEEELFQNAATALAHILISDKLKRRAKGYERIVIQGNSMSELLVNFLNEVLTQSQIDKKVYERVKILKFSPTGLEAHIFGISVDRFNKDVKAVTYHGVDIKRNKRGIFETIILLDV